MEQAIVSAVTHDTSEAKVTVTGVPDQPGIAAPLFRSLADRDVNVDMIVQNVSDHGVTDISFTVPHEDLDASRGDRRGARRRDRRRRASAPTTRSRRCQPRRRGHEVAPRRRGHDVRDARRARHQHRDDLDLGDPHHLRGARSRQSSRPSSRCTRLRPLSVDDPGRAWRCRSLAGPCESGSSGPPARSAA